jgi:hypothetical protein
MKLNRILSIAFTLHLSIGIASVGNAQLPSKEKNADSSAVDGMASVNVDNFVRAESDHRISTRKS